MDDSSLTTCYQLTGHCQRYRSEVLDVLFDDDGLVLTLIGVGRSQQVSYPKIVPHRLHPAHQAGVDEVNRRIREDGYDIARRHHRRSALLNRCVPCVVRPPR
jgi:hypothetical protein